MFMHNEENQTPSRLIFEEKACRDSDADNFARKKSLRKLDMSIKTETRKFERKRLSDFLFLVHNFTAADRLNPASPSGNSDMADAQ